MLELRFKNRNSYILVTDSRTTIADVLKFSESKIGKGGEISIKGTHSRILRVKMNRRSRMLVSFSVSRKEIKEPWNASLTARFLEFFESKMGIFCQKQTFPESRVLERPINCTHSRIPRTRIDIEEFWNIRSTWLILVLAESRIEMEEF